MQALSKFVSLALELGALEAVLAPLSKLVIDYRFYLKCRFGCPHWNKYWTCPSAPDFPKPWEFKGILDSYTIFLAIRTSSDGDSQRVSYEVERAAQKDGLLLAFSISNCAVLCNYECTYPNFPCRYPEKARPSPSALCIDVSKTAHNLSMKFEFNSNDWYSYVFLI